MGCFFGTSWCFSPQKFTKDSREPMGSGEAPSPGGAEAPSWRPGKIPGGCSRSQIHGFYLIFLWGFIWDFEDSLGDFILNFGHFISPFVQSFGLF